MGTIRKLTVSADDVWSTTQAAKFLDISRQAINRRVQNRKMLGYPGGGATLFPVWQFDVENRGIRPEIPEFLAAFDEDVEPQVIAEWSITKIDEFDRTPAELLLCPNTKRDALHLAGICKAAAIEEGPVSTAESNVKRAGKEIAEWRPSQPGSTGAQHAILLAAADLFSRKGPAKVTLREIAAAADVSYGLIYRFYRTKENLLVAVMELLVSYGGERLSGEEDVYAAIDRSFGADIDSGQFGRMLMWSIFEGTSPDRLLGGARSGGYLSQINALWENPVEPQLRAEFDSSVLASLIGLVASVWDLYEPYLTELADNPGRDREGSRQQVTDLLKLLVYAARPNR
ncbi:MAG: TetR/AcrR family transcriptional regulator [Rhodococcus sp.]|uniref:TetR/AcrR family transcriptional regulator n=1 Tax=Rhodococcus sp. MEB032 TaxID=3040322 RepID=UPI0022A2F605|nr:TetR/AcrR family transcriptional regulator [Rhodococcus sp. MEB032]MCY4667808.1 TetR/AcrR family transcriptional regulator [Rhodococcus sp. (in: high G+C Gram-positive bacteria)]